MRIGIVGSDNSHALGFARLINVEGQFGPDVRVASIWGADSQEAADVAKQADIAEVVPTVEDMVANVDAAIVVDRHGNLHRAHAAPFLAVGMAVFVDKPLATSVADARTILADARRGKGQVTSYSSLRWYEGTRRVKEKLASCGSLRLLTVSGPCDVSSVYGGHFFYGVHLVEIASELVPGEIESVRAVQASGATTVVLRRVGGPVVTLNFFGPDEAGRSARFPFHVTVFGTERFEATEIPNDPDHSASLRRFLDMASGGEGPVSEEDMVRSIAVLEAVGGSLANGGDEVKVRPGSSE